MTAQFTAGQPLHVAFPMLDTTDPLQFAPSLSVTIAAWVHDGTSWESLDIADTAAEIGTSGVYEISLTGEETTGAEQILLKASADGAAETAMLFRTSASAQLNRIELQTQRLTADTAIQYRSHVQVDGSLSLTIGDDYVGTTYRLNVPVTDADEFWHTYLTSEDVTEITFSARHCRRSATITGTIDADNITHDSGTTTIVVEITQTQLGTVSGEYEYHLDATDADGNHNFAKGALKLERDA